MDAMDVVLNNVMMACGHSANATTMQGNQRIPCCVICAPSPESFIIAELPSLEGRFAKCTYDNERSSNHGEPVPSSVSLAFFEYRGENSQKALNMCKHCSYHYVAHIPHNWGSNPEGIKDHEFEPHGVYEYDLYYDGCMGWD